jgi:F0F1-type ATP synthase assembly protein I
MEFQTVSKNKTEEKRLTNAQWMKLAGIGTEMAAAIFTFVFIGQFLDKHFKTTSPWITILMLFIGVAAAFYLVYKQLR